MSYGYSLRLAKLNAAADHKLLGVLFGAVCIEHNVPVATVAGKFGVSRQAVYNWFTGVSKPSVSAALKIQALIEKLEQ
tara:strand:- start:526 stop:759 length:234 start_codon:yes stop_codon:yes gene_type:complete